MAQWFQPTFPHYQWSECFSASSFRLDSQHTQQGKHGFEGVKLPVIPAGEIGFSPKPHITCNIIRDLFDQMFSFLFKLNIYQPIGATLSTLCSSTTPEPGYCNIVCFSVKVTFFPQPSGSHQIRLWQQGGQSAEMGQTATHLPPIQIMNQASSRSAGQPEMAVLNPPTVQDLICKLPVIKNIPRKCSRPKSVNLHRLPCVLPPISRGTEELNRSFKLPPGF